MEDKKLTDQFLSSLFKNKREKEIAELLLEDLNEEEIVKKLVGSHEKGRTK